MKVEPGQIWRKGTRVYLLDTAATQGRICLRDVGGEIVNANYDAVKAMEAGNNDWAFLGFAMDESAQLLDCSECGREKVAFYPNDIMCQQCRDQHPQEFRLIADFNDESGILRLVTEPGVLTLVRDGADRPLVTLRAEDIPRGSRQAIKKFLKR